MPIFEIVTKLIQTFSLSKIYFNLSSEKIFITSIYWIAYSSNECAEKE